MNFALTLLISVISILFLLSLLFMFSYIKRLYEERIYDMKKLNKIEKYCEENNRYCKELYDCVREARMRQ